MTPPAAGPCFPIVREVTVPTELCRLSLSQSLCLLKCWHEGSSVASHSGHRPTQHTRSQGQPLAKLYVVVVRGDSTGDAHQSLSRNVANTKGTSLSYWGRRKEERIGGGRPSPNLRFRRKRSTPHLWEGCSSELRPLMFLTLRTASKLREGRSHEGRSTQNGVLNPQHFPSSARIWRRSSVFPM